MAISWTAFTYALTHGQVLAASLGYFINPLFSILLGVIFLRERLVFSEKMVRYFYMCRCRLSNMAVWRTTYSSVSDGERICDIWINT